ncbi:type II toxin-antitoxin system VapC family toxin [bacterium]|nr:MAG: type II toxin-antitoxin system VapC family toxin [bacterium]
MIAVLDSSAMLAFLAGEPEGIAVDALFTSSQQEDEGILIYAHSVNLCETFYGILAQHGATAAEDAITFLKEAGLVERSDMDGDFWRDVARLVVAGRQLPKPVGGRGNLAFGDAVGIALTNRLEGEFVTKDRTEIEPAEAAGLVKAYFIR